MLRSWLRWVAAVVALQMALVQLPAFGSPSARAAVDKAGPDAVPVDVATLRDKDLARFIAYVERRGRGPIDYVVAKLQDHDTVILGEMHEVPENLAFVGSLILPLYQRAGVRCLATEFLRHRNTARANQILTAPQYDEAAVVDLYRDFAGVWGFKEYMDILKAIWELNHSLPAGAERFRVLGLDGDVEEYDLRRAPEDQRPAVMQKLMERDAYMAETLAKEAMVGGGKVLLHTGYVHSFTRYRLPVVADGKLVREMEPRLGGLLARRYGTKVFQICLHQWHFGPEFFGGGQPSLREPLGGLIEKAVATRRGASVGFDVEGSPFANLRDRQSAFFAYQDQVMFSDLAQGYILLKPLRELQARCTWVPGFVSSANFEKARGLALQRGWIHGDECSTPAQLDRRLQSIFEAR